MCFVTGEPSGLTVTLPLALAELNKAAPDGAKIMLGSGRGGAYAQVFRHCREQQVHWVTYRRAPLAVPAGLPVLTTITAGGKARQVAWAAETAGLNDYGQSPPGGPAGCPAQAGRHGAAPGRRRREHAQLAVVLVSNNHYALD